jgi:hypothetical protein
MSNKADVKSKGAVNVSSQSTNSKKKDVLKKVKEEVKVVDESDDESDNEKDIDSESDSGSDSESDSGSESDEELNVAPTDEQDKQKDKQKDKAKKLSHKELTSELLSNEEKISELETKLSELEKSIQATEREQNALRRTNLRLIKQLDKAHDDDVNKARKEKKKRNVTEESGILKCKPIPKVLKEFLGLEQSTELPRTKVMSLLSNKFNDLKLRKGQDIHLDKKTAKLFGKDDKYIIEFKYFQRFLKEIYESDNKTTEVKL